MKPMRYTLMAAATVAAYSAYAGELTLEGFDANGPIADYTGVGKVFHSNVLTGAPVADALNGECRMEVLANVVGALYTDIDLGGTRTLLSMKLDYKGVQYGAATTPWAIYVGSFTNAAHFNPGWNPIAGSRNWAMIRVGGSAPYTVTAVDGTNGNNTVSGQVIGTSYTWSLYCNETGSTATYRGPDGSDHSLDTARWSLFVGSTVVGENMVKGTAGSSGSLKGIIFHVARNWSGGVSRSAIDNIVVRDDLDLYPKPDPITLLILK